MEAEKAGLAGLPLEGEWLSTFKKYQTFTELDRVMLAELVETIEIHENKSITIRFKFADQIERVQQYLLEMNASALSANASVHKQEVTDHGQKE